jgi:hypothetical protein
MDVEVRGKRFEVGGKKEQGRIGESWLMWQLFKELTSF